MRAAARQRAEQSLDYRVYASALGAFVADAIEGAGGKA